MRDYEKMELPPKQSSSTSILQERVRDLLSDADAARESGDMRLAQSLVNAVLALDPTNVRAKGLIQGSAVRRQMTLLFCDIVGSTQLADDRDPEEVTALLAAYRTTCSEIIDRYGGFIDDHRGDGMLVLFGYPQVNEDDGRRAVMCGRTIVKTLNRRMRTIMDRPDEVAVKIRVTVHTGLVVLDGVGVAGATANEAARIQDYAPPDTVVISDTTKELVWPYFETSSIGVVGLRGVSRPVEIFAVVRERSRPQRSVPTSPFVGRHQELAGLQDFLAGQVPLLVVSGQAGVGKTRLVGEATRRSGVQILECRCSRVERNTSLHVFRGLIEQSCGIEQLDSPEDRLAKLRVRVGVAMSDSGDFPFLSAALGIPLTLLAPPVDIDPSQLRQDALHAASGLIRKALDGTPTTVFIDDAHWADQSSIDLIGHLLAGPLNGLRLVVTARDEFEPPWAPELMRRLALEPLTRGQLQELAELLPQANNIPKEDLDELIDRSDGIPLFLEELLRTAEDVGRGQIVHRSIRFGDYQVPPALRDSLLARLASPQVDLDLVQVAATIGRDVDRNLLQRVTPSTSAEFGNRISTLQDAGLVEISDNGLRFRHELIREVAYESQRRSTRRRNHSAVADAIHQGGDMTNRSVSEMAIHLERAERYGEAVVAHLQVAQADQAVGAHSEVINRLTHALVLVDQLPDDPDKLRTELQIRTMRSFSAVASQGYGAPEVGDDYQRTAELGWLLADAPEFLPTLLSSWTYFIFTGALDKADEIIVSLIGACAAAGQSDIAFAACYGVGEFFRGHFNAASRRLEAYIESEWVNDSDRPPMVLQVPSDSLCAFAAHNAFIHWAQGDRTTADKYFEWAISRVNQLIFPFGPFTSCYVSHFVACIQTLAGDYSGLARTGTHMQEIADRHSFAMWQVTAALHLNLSAVMQGRHDAIGPLTEHVAICRDLLGARIHMPYWMTQLGRAQREAGLATDAINSLNVAIEIATETDCMFYAAETLRIRGQLRLETDNSDGLEDLQRAIGLAEEQGAAAFAERIRATMRDAVTP